MDVESGDQRILVDQVSKPSNPGDFPGLYVDQLPRHITLSLGAQKDSHVIMHTVWECNSVLVAISLSDGTVTKITSDTEHDVPSSWAMLATDGGNRVLCSKSTCRSPNQLLLVTLSDSLQGNFRSVDETIQGISPSGEIYIASQLLQVSDVLPSSIETR